MPTIMRNGIPTHISIEEYNETLAKHRKDVLGIDESTGKLRHYTVQDLGKIWVNGQEFTGMAYQGLLTVNTKTYVEEPKRANDGSIPNINDYDTFVVPRCKVNFKYFNIEDYRRLCDAVMSNEFYVKYYDKQHNEFVQHKMYCEPEEMVKLYNVGTDVFGVLDYEVSFIGTLNDLAEYTVTYLANGGTIKGNPTLYDANDIYRKGDRVYLADATYPDDETKRRYFEAIYYKNTFSKEEFAESADLGNTVYWSSHGVATEYSQSSSYSQGNVAYSVVLDDEGEETGRRYYLAIYQGQSFNEPLTDTNYWELITVKKYSSSTTYSSNKVSRDDTALGQFVIDESSGVVYEAIYFTDTFNGHHPTEMSYWSQMALGTGIKVKWGNSIVVADAESLFDAPEGSANSWGTKDGTTTKPNGEKDYGFVYIEGQSVNVFKNLTLYAIWE